MFVYERVSIRANETIERIEMNVQTNDTNDANRLEKTNE